jgi:N-acetylmuramoyl-L-alanine amidase
MYEFIPSPNHTRRYGGKTVKAVVLHYTALPWQESIERMTDEDIPVSAHYLAGIGGRIVQLVKDDRRAWHAGRSELYGETDVNSISIGIEMENLGLLRPVRGTNKKEFTWWKDHYSAPYDKQKWGEPYHRLEDDSYWAPYADLQLEFVFALCLELVQRHNIEGPRWIVGHSFIAPDRKVDPGPAFPLFKLRKQLFGAETPRLDVDEYANFLS